MRNVRDPLHHEIEAINTPVGLTLIRKSKARAQGQRSKRPSKIALVLAGGAMTGGAFKMGGLKALNDFLVGRDIVDFDIYVGLSAGAFLAAPLSSGIGPEELLRSLNGHSSKIGKFQPWDF